jgi:hypothetical protein
MRGHEFSVQQNDTFQLPDPAPGDEGRQRMKIENQVPYGGALVTGLDIKRTTGGEWKMLNGKVSLRLTFASIRPADSRPVASDRQLWVNRYRIGPHQRSSYVRNAPLATAGPRNAACPDGPEADSRNAN